MHRSVKTLVLTLILMETGAVRRKITHNPAVDVWRKFQKPGARTLVEAEQRVFSGPIQQQTAGEVSGLSGGMAVGMVGGVSGAMPTQYLDMGTSGVADLEIKLDMRAVLAQLQMIPTLGKLITNMEGKVDSILVNNQGSGLENQILALGKVLESRMVTDESRIETLIQMVQQLQTKTANVDTKLDNLNKENSNAFGSGGIPGCNTSGIDEQASNILQLLPKIATKLEKLIFQVNKNLGTLQGNMLKSFSAMQQEMSVLDKITRPGYLCTAQTTATKTETQILSTLTNFANMLNKIPQQIISTIPQIVGRSNDTMQHLNSLTQLSQYIRSDIDSVRSLLLQDKEEVKKFFAESQKSMYHVKKIVTETTQVVQSSAAAAISASRSLRCKNQRADLDD